MAKHTFVIGVKMNTSKYLGLLITVTTLCYPNTKPISPSTTPIDTLAIERTQSLRSTRSIPFETFKEYAFPQSSQGGIFSNSISYVKWPCVTDGVVHLEMYACTFRKVNDSIFVFLDDVKESSGYCEGATPLLLIDLDSTVQRAPAYISFPITEDTESALMFSDRRRVSQKELNNTRYFATKERVERVALLSKNRLKTYTDGNFTRIPLHLVDEIFNVSLDTLFNDISIDTMYYGEYHQLFPIKYNGVKLYLEKQPEFKCFMIFDIKQEENTDEPVLDAFDNWDTRLEDIIDALNAPR